MTPECDVCLIDDDGSQRRLVTAALDRLGFTWVEAENGQHGYELVSKHHPKVVLCDWAMPVVDGPRVLEMVREDPEIASTYFIMMTAHNTPTREFEALEAGADDYITKPVEMRELRARLRVGHRVWGMQHSLTQAAITDGLTGLYNHDHLNRILEVEWKRSRRYGSPMSLIMMDIDYFKAINDTYGHLVGNTTLEEVAHVLRTTTRDVDYIGRFGGDEFAVVAPEASLEEAAAMAERIRVNICEVLEVEAVRDHVITVSVGVAGADDARARNVAELVDLADRAMYVSKRRGRNQVSTALDIEDQAGQAMELIQTGDVEELRQRVAVLSVQTKRIYVQSIGALVQALEEKDPYTAKHSVNVSYYAEQIAAQMGCSESLVLAVRSAGLLHDVGKVGIPDRILMKPTHLNDLEQTVIQQVPLISTRIIDHLLILDSERHIIRHQWEHFNGKGCPAGLKGDQIPIGSRILLVADAFDAMTTDRVYRKRVSIEESLRELKQYAGVQFDPRVVHSLEQLARQNRRTWRSRIAETVESVRLLAVPEHNS